MPEKREEILEERRRLKVEYRHLFGQVESLLFRHDPVGINFETNIDEYDPGVGTILPRLRAWSGAERARNVGPFVRMPPKPSTGTASNGTSPSSSISLRG